MAPDRPPGAALARHRLARMLRLARTAAGLSQAAAANHLEWSASKLMRVENSQVWISVTDVKALLAVYEVTDPEMVELAADLTRLGRYQTWQRPGLTDDFARYLELEKDADVLRQFEPAFMPGLLQTPDYARAVLRTLAEPSTPADEIEQRVQIRMERRRVFHRDPVAETHFVIDEAAMRRMVGGRSVMRTQLHHLRHLAQRPSVTMQVLPFTAGATMGIRGGFTILEFTETDEPLVYLENPRGDQIAMPDGDPHVEDRRKSFHTLSLLSSPPKEFPAVVDRLLDRLDDPPLWLPAAPPVPTEPAAPERAPPSDRP